MYLKRLTEDDAIAVDAVWPNRHRGSVFFLKRMAAWNENVGLYRDDGSMVAWSFRFQAGPIGALQVAEKFQRNGYGKVIGAAITRQIGALGHDVYACVGLENEPSKRLFQSLGFSIVDRTFWLRTDPIVPFQWNDE